MNPILVLHVAVALVVTLEQARAKQVNIGGIDYDCKDIRQSCAPRLRDGNVCATNGRTFTSLCELIFYACDIDLDKNGVCDAISTTAIFGTAISRTTTDAESSKCPKCKGATGPKVCGSDHITYKNKCWLQRQSCKLERQRGEGIRMMYELECDDEESISSDPDSSTWMHADYDYGG